MKTEHSRSKRVRGRVRVNLDGKTWILEMFPLGLKIRRLHTHGRHVYHVSHQDLLALATGQKLLPLP
jgi:hypothetical protein